ncbi:MAG: YkgB family protein [Xanthobacteraceae bacterium]|nr:YkgB family protein [Xanthobacteraceae bacterium]
MKERLNSLGALFTVAENGAGSYRMLALLRWVMVVVFVSFGMQKFTEKSAAGIAQFISNSPLVWWLQIFGFRGEAYFLGVVEFSIAALLIAGAFVPLLSAVGSLMGVVTFAVTWSFFFTTPGVVTWSISTDPMAWNLAGEFLFKDIVLLCVCVVLLLASIDGHRCRSRSLSSSRFD